MLEQAALAAMRSVYLVLAFLALAIQRSKANFPMGAYPYSDNSPFGFHNPQPPYPYMSGMSAAAPPMNAPQPAPAYPFGYPYDLYNWYSRLFDNRMLFNNVPHEPFPRGRGPLFDNSFFPPMVTKKT